MSEITLPTAEFAHAGLRLRVASPPPDLAPFISAYYRTEVDTGVIAEDWLPPEEGNLRTGIADVYDAAIGSAPLGRAPVAVLSGPTNRVTQLRIGGGRFWGIGLTPAGWARFIGRPADGMADRFAGVEECQLNPSLVRMLDTLRHEIDDMAEAAALIARTFRPMVAHQPARERPIRAIHLSIVSDEALSFSIAELAERAGMTERTFVRFCKRHFGFAPGVLLRRQRFLRSLGKYMLDPSLRWINSLDPHYCDQAQFIRDFRAIMQMTPGEYAALPHPIVTAAVSVTNAGSGVAMQALFHPERRRESETGL
ncbi:AraC family transcriptional regulator [Erythrobacter sp. SDW2]|uniref:helix-turn-helix domain-containing protein n=1 Tax=Erythrobacter sp. SDW2 TaxID=2907154 RepID=UPI001F19B81E|nr:AraC family transcriptional regulator [Erythrobacter sp. SDW2]UIP07168.1 AraC family transcriptional regulator [Erythrobacter sp. SDW2]